MARLGCAAFRAVSAALSSAKVASVLVFGGAGLRRSTVGAVALVEGAGFGGSGALAQAARDKYAVKQTEREKFAVMLLLIGENRSQALS